MADVHQEKSAKEARRDSAWLFAKAARSDGSATEIDMRNLSAVLLLASIASCSSHSSSKPVNPAARKRSSLPLASQPSAGVSVPRVRYVEEGLAERTSDRLDAHGKYHPPWKDIRIINFLFPEKPKVGSKVTVLPLRVNIAPIELKIE
jgi:hypothetical protein